jgi:hypothetical protein
MGLGRLTGAGGVMLDPMVDRFPDSFDTRRSDLVCLPCGVEQTLRESAALPLRTVSSILTLRQ